MVLNSHGKSSLQILTIMPWFSTPMRPDCTKLFRIVALTRTNSRIPMCTVLGGQTLSNLWEAFQGVFVIAVFCLTWLCTTWLQCILVSYYSDCLCNKQWMNATLWILTQLGIWSLLKLWLYFSFILFGKHKCLPQSESQCVIAKLNRTVWIV